MPRGKAKKSIELIDAAVEILNEIQPATVRAVCYRLFTAGMIPNMSKNSTNRVSTQLVWARENDVIPWDWIVDETREAERANLWDSIDEIINASVKGYRRNYWQEQQHWVEVWSEKGTVRGTLSPVLEKYGVTFRVMHGYGSATAIHDIAEESAISDKPLTVFYVGDFDCSGLHMSEVDIPNRIDRYDGDADIERIALTDSDVRGTGLPRFDAATKRGDPRYNWYVSRYGQHCWELDALSPVILRRRVEDAITGLIDKEAWDRALLVEKAEIKSIQDFSERWKEGISMQASKYTATDGSAAP